MQNQIRNFKTMKDILGTVAFVRMKEAWLRVISYDEDSDELFCVDDAEDDGNGETHEVENASTNLSPRDVLVLASIEYEAAELDNFPELNALCERCSGHLQVCISYKNSCDDEFTYEESVRVLGGHLLIAGKDVSNLSDLDDLGRAWCEANHHEFVCIEV